MRYLVALLFLAFSPVLGSCGGPLFQSTTATVPTPAGNGRIRYTNAFGVVVTDIENPPGIDRACLANIREWNDYLIRTHTPNTQNAWVEWMRQASLINAPAQCMNYATFGIPLGGGNASMGMMGGGYGAGPFNGRFQKRSVP